jgi:hypothetical protein
VEQTVTQVELPVVSGTKDWGTYSAEGLAIQVRASR